MVVPKAGGIEAEGKVFHDPVHGQIALHPLLVKIIDTPEFQRLRSIKQLGGVSFVYPGGSHSRFEHSIGVAHLAGELAYNLQSRQKELDITDRDILCVQIAGLCHDLGHGPFSHLYDKVKQSHDNTWKHEKASEWLFDHLVKHNGLEDEMEKYGLKEEQLQKDLTFIKEMINPVKKQKPWEFEGREVKKSFLYEIVANKLNGIDVDKFDYLDRDCHHLGLKNTFDYQRYFLLARVCNVNGRNHICLREKDEGNLYDMFYSRYSLHRRVYQHKVTQNVELMITEAFKGAKPLLKLSEPTNQDNIEDYIKLTDGVFEKILYSSDEENMIEARKILQQIHKRSLYKFVGEEKDTRSNEEKEDLIVKLEKDLLPPGSLEVPSFIFDFGKDDKDYLDQMCYYRLEKPQDTLSNEEKKKLKADLERGLLPPGSLEVHTFKFDFGKGDKDPLDQMYFYRKDKPEEGFTIPKEKRSTLLPQHFCETRFRVYWKNTETSDEVNEKLQELKKTFSEWFQRQRSVGTQTLPEDGNNEGQN